jgi:urease accessory protein
MNIAALYRLMTWLSPAFPVGGYTHSGGLEWAVDEKLVVTQTGLVGWIADVLVSGSGHSDALFFAHAYQAAVSGDPGRLLEIAEFAAALHPSRERRFEATAQGAAFRRIAAATADYPTLALLTPFADDMLCYPIVVATLVAGHGVPLASALTGYLHGLVSNLVSAAQRLIPLGQTDGQIAIAALEQIVAKVVGDTVAGVDHDLMEVLGSATLMADFASLAHETQYTRLFRT